jgi:hypothetical protein
VTTFTFIQSKCLTPRLSQRAHAPSYTFSRRLKQELSASHNSPSLRTIRRTVPGASSGPYVGYSYLKKRRPIVVAHADSPLPLPLYPCFVCLVFYWQLCTSSRWYRRIPHQLSRWYYNTTLRIRLYLYSLNTLRCTIWFRRVLVSSLMGTVLPVLFIFLGFNVDCKYLS